MATTLQEGAMCQAPSTRLATGPDTQRGRLRLRGHMQKSVTMVEQLAGGGAGAQTLASCAWSLPSFLHCCPTSWAIKRPSQHAGVSPLPPHSPPPPPPGLPFPPPRSAQLSGPRSARVSASLQCPLSWEDALSPVLAPPAQRQPCAPTPSGAFLACNQLLQRNPELDFSDHPMATVTST